MNVRELSPEERPWELLKSISRDSVLQMRLARFHLTARADPHGSHVPLFVGNLPANLNQRQYENILVAILGKGEDIRRAVSFAPFSHGCPVFYAHHVSSCVRRRSSGVKTISNIAGSRVWHPECRLGKA